VHDTNQSALLLRQISIPWHSTLELALVSPAPR
jgi:hypothetical protein